MQTSAGQRITAGLLSEDYATSSTSAVTVTGTSYTNLSKSFTIPANDPAAGTAYRVTAFGYGTWGSTQQTLNISNGINGSQVGSQAGINSTDFAASATLRWQFRMVLLILTTGSGGTYAANVEGTIVQQDHVLTPGTAANNTVPLSAGVAAATSIDTTSAITMAIFAEWASATGSPTITCLGSVFERLGG